MKEEFLKMEEIKKHAKEKLHNGQGSAQAGKPVVTHPSASVAHKLQQTWEWLNGKKTTIGAIVLLVYNAPNLAGILHLTPEVWELLLYFGSILVGGGVAHKAGKGAINYILTSGSPKIK